MPLLTSPIDGSPMKQINRYGIEIDVCPTSGGVWLDKGELEKLMMLMQEASQEEQQYMQQRRPAAAYANGSGRYDDDDYRHGHHHKGKHKKKGALSQMMEIFDF